MDHKITTFQFSKKPPTNRLEHPNNVPGHFSNLTEMAWQTEHPRNATTI